MGTRRRRRSEEEKEQSSLSSSNYEQIREQRMKENAQAWFIKPFS